MAEVGGLTIGSFVDTILDIGIDEESAETFGLDDTNIGFLFDFNNVTSAPATEFTRDADEDFFLQFAQNPTDTIPTLVPGETLSPALVAALESKFGVDAEAAEALGLGTVSIGDLFGGAAEPTTFSNDEFGDFVASVLADADNPVSSGATAEALPTADSNDIASSLLEVLESQYGVDAQTADSLGFDEIALEAFLTF